MLNFFSLPDNSASTRGEQVIQQQQDPSTPGPSGVQNVNKAAFVKQPNLLLAQNDNVEEQRGFYKDLSTDCSDVDDPPAVPRPPRRQPRRQPMELRKDISYVIFEHEGAFFPGLVARKSNKVHLKRMHKGNSETSWIFPEKDDILVMIEVA